MVSTSLEQDTITAIVTPSAFVLVKASQALDFMETYRELDSCRYKIACDAVKGDWDIILSYKSGSVEKTEAIYNDDLKGFEGIAKSEFLTVCMPPNEEEVKGTEFNTERGDGKKVQSYILINAETSKINSIYSLMIAEEKVDYCAFTLGAYNLLLLVSGKQFSDIDKLISKKIMNFDGILKVKEYPIINIYDL